MKLSPYLTFDGKCEAALKFYETCLGGRIKLLLTYGESPMAKQVPPEWEAKVIHATFEFGKQTFGAADSFPGYYRKPQGFSVTVDVDTPQEADRIAKALAEGGTVEMPVQETFWALRFGMLTDRFGTPWMINCGKPH